MKKSVVVMAALVWASVGAQAQSLKDASFESLVLDDGVAQRVNNYTLPGWRVSKRDDIAHSQVKVRDIADGNTRYQPVGENLAVVTNGAQLWQTFATVAGVAYTFNFLWDAVGSSSTLRVSDLGGDGTLFKEKLVADAERGLASTSVSFVAQGALTTISFMAGTPLVGNAARGAAAESRLLLDNFQFAAAVPEPSGSAMVLAGLGALALMFRRRRLR